MIRSIRQFLNSEQFNPGFFGLWVNPFFLARHALHQAIQRMAPAMYGDLLDVGCGSKPYRNLFAAQNYVGLEIDTPTNRANKQADVYYDGLVFPFESGKFDGVVCYQVLEHVFEPSKFLGEIRRVLKSEGKLFLTMPFVWDEHEQPWDYARYSSFGVKYLLESHGFRVVEQQKTNADIRALCQLVNVYLYKALRTRQALLNLLVCIVLMAPFSILGMLLYKLLPSNPDLYLDQVVLAIKVKS